MSGEERRAEERRTWEDDYPAGEPQSSGGFLDYVEGVLLRVALIGLILLILGQTVLGQDLTMVFMSYADRLSFNPLEPQRPVVKDVFGPTEKRQAVLAFQLVSHPSAPGLVLLVNGVPSGEFIDDRVTITVHEGDELVLDGSALDGTYTVRVTLVGGNVSFPPEGEEFSIEGDELVIGTVR